VTIDFHTHVLPPSFQRDLETLRGRDATFASLFDGTQRMATTDDLVAALDEDGINAAVAVGYGWCDPAMARKSNDYLLDAAQKHPGKIIPFCSVHPGWGDDPLAEVERCIAQGARGIGELHPTSQGIDLATDPHLDGLMELALRHGLPVMVHGSEPVGHAYPGKGIATPEVLLAFAQRYPQNTIICAHWGGGLPFYSLMPEVRKALANVYFDSAVSPFLYASDIFPVAVKAAGAKHVLFASDFPLMRPKRVLEQARESLTLAGMGDDLDAVLHDNAARLLGLA
jgi:predicted TIM-barrel fold metal-dependent hydrolase